MDAWEVRTVDIVTMEGVREIVYGSDGRSQLFRSPSLS